MPADQSGDAGADPTAATEGASDGLRGPAFDAALAVAAAAGPPAIRVLDIAAYLAPRQIPRDIFPPDELGEAGRNSSIEALIACGLAMPDPLDGGEPGIQVPTTVQAEMRRRHSVAGQDAARIRVALEAVTRAYPAGADAGEVRCWPVCERLDRHANAVLAFAPDEGEGAEITSDLLHRLSHYRFARGRYEEAEPIVRRSGAVDEVLLGPDHPQVGQDRANLAILLHEMGRTEEALQHIRKAMAIGEAELGPEHPLVAERYNILAMLLETLGRHSEADPFIRHALVTSEQVLGPDHPDTQAYRAVYDRVVAGMEAVARTDEAVEAGLAPAPLERLARRDLPPPPAPRQRGVLGRLLKGKQG